jgi:hypothetical protein
VAGRTWIVKHGWGWLGPQKPRPMESPGVLPRLYDLSQHFGRPLGYLARPLSDHRAWGPQHPDLETDRLLRLPTTETTIVMTGTLPANAWSCCAKVMNWCYGHTPLYPTRSRFFG